MKAVRRRTGFDRYVEEEMKSPGFAASYAEARKEVASTDDIIRALQAAKRRSRVRLADIARQMDTTTSVVQAWLKGSDTLTLHNLVRLAQILHLKLVLTRN